MVVDLSVPTAVKPSAVSVAAVVISILPTPFTATSSDTSVVNTVSVGYTSANSTGTLTFTPGGSGMTTITVTVTDDGGTAGDTSDDKSFVQTFTVSVNANVPPKNTTPLSPTTNEDVTLAFNGTNLINSSDTTKTLKVAFNSDNTSNVTLRNVDATSAGLGLTGVTLDATNSFAKNTDVDTTLTGLTSATSKLRSYATSFGSKLTIVQNRQDFTKNLINTLQTGSSNLVNADLNEEAANSQALATRQSLAISALSLANTAQQNVLQLLR